ncbi:DoxX family protein [Winogradskyella sp.]|uniref:DoxX family protein n=1 Tax=Winogradskyella sp. TaxID=1883156 RepID=UPI0026224596|nr:DoxX family protein [Winogradskyella sp.]
MKNLFFKTDNNLASPVLRIPLGIVILVHGVTKLGSGFEPFEQFIVDYMELPSIVAYVTVFIETASALMLILGFATRLNAIAFFGLFTGMIVTVHYAIGFSMNWNGQLEPGQEGYEYHLLVLAISSALVVLGSGKFSIDRLIETRNENRRIKAKN